MRLVLSDCLGGTCLNSKWINTRDFAFGKVRHDSRIGRGSSDLRFWCVSYRRAYHRADSKTILRGHSKKTQHMSKPTIA